MSCERIEARWVDIRAHGEGEGPLEMEKLEKAVETVYKDGKRLKWKPEPIVSEGRLFGYVLWVQHDC